MDKDKFLKRKTTVNVILIFIIVILLLTGIISYIKNLVKEREMGDIIYGAMTNVETVTEKAEKALSVMERMSFSQNGTVLFVSIYNIDDEFEWEKFSDAIQKAKDEIWFRWDYIVVDVFHYKLGMILSIEINVDTMETKDCVWYDQEIKEDGVSEGASEDLTDASELIYQDENLVVKYTGITGSNTQYKVGLEIENKSDKTLTIQFRETSIDGVMVTPIGSIEIAPGKKALDGMSIWSDDAQNHPPKSIKSIETKLCVHTIYEHIIKSTNKKRSWIL